MCLLAELRSMSLEEIDVILENINIDIDIRITELCDKHSIEYDNSFLFNYSFNPFDSKLNDLLVSRAVLVKYRGEKYGSVTR